MTRRTAEQRLDDLEERVNALERRDLRRALETKYAVARLTGNREECAKLEKMRVRLEQVAAKA